MLEIPARILLTATLTAALCLAGSAAADDKKARADALVKEGAALGQAGKLAEAIEKFQEAEALFPRAMHHCNIGLTYKRMSRPAEAHFFMARCRRRARKSRTRLPGWVGNVIRKLVKTLEAGDFGRVTLQIRPAAAEKVIRTFLPREVVEEATRVWLPVGEHRLDATSTGHEAAQREFEVTRGGKNTLTLTLTRTQTPTTKQTPAAPPAPSRSETRPWIVAFEGNFSAGGDIAEESRVPGVPASTIEVSAPASMGGAIRFERSVLKYLSVGVRAFVGVSQLEAADRLGIGKDIVIRANAVIRGVIPIGSRGEVYLSMPIGATIMLIDDGWEQATVANNPNLTNVSFGTGLGFNVSLLAGVQWLFSGPFGAFCELGWLHERYSIDVSNTLNTGEVIEQTLARHMNQFAIKLGVVLAF